MAYANPLKNSILVYALCLLLHSSLCHAIDNPDAPDYVANFEARSKKFEFAIQEQAKSNNEIVNSYKKYEIFLNQELNLAFAALTKQLGSTAKLDLARSQISWLKYRDDEFQFITDNWTIENFGTSYVYSRGDYRTSLIKDRIVKLLYYMKNY